MRTIEFYKDLLIEQSTILGVASNQALEYIEMIIGLGAPLHKVLRLLCLQSLVDKGIKGKVFDEIRKEIIHVRNNTTFWNNLTLPFLLFF